MYVLTIDQRASRRRDDRVPGLLGALDGPGAVPAVLGAERTVGDELQLVVAEAEAVVAVVETTCRQGGWTVGIGAGHVEEPMPASTRAARGSAFTAARAAVERAKHTTARLAVRGAGTRGDDPYAVVRAESALWLLVAVVGRRTQRGWQVVDAMRMAGSQRAAAERLGVSAQAVSQVLAAAGWAEAERGGALAAWLLEQM